jgi:hypothetical protein
MNDNTRAVRGPMYVDATPLMVTADVTPLVHANVAELLDLLSSEFYDDFREVADQEPTGHDGHAPERLGFERLAELLVERMSTKVALTGPQAVRAAGRMHKLGLPLAEAAERTKAAVTRGASLIKHPSHAATREHLREHPLPGQRDRRTA